MKMHVDYMAASLLVFTGTMCCFCPAAALASAQDDRPAESTAGRTEANVPVTAGRIVDDPTSDDALADGKATMLSADTADASQDNSNDADPARPESSDAGDATTSDPPAVTAAHSRPVRFIPAPGKQPEDSDGGEKSGFWNVPAWSLRTLGATGAVLGLILLGASLLKRSNRSLAAGGRAVGGLVEVLARYPLGRNQTLSLIKIDRRILILCQGPQETSLLSEISDPEEVVSILHKCRDDQGESFDRRLEDILRQSETGRSDEMSDAWPDAADGGHAIVDLTRPAKRRIGRGRRAAAQTSRQGVVG